MNQLLLYDKELFKHINYDWQNSFFDWLMPWLRNANLWYPLYFFMVLFIVINYKKTGWWWVIFCCGAVFLSNMVSSDLMKENIIRLRPCNDPAIADWVRVLVGYRPQSSSFTSSHAANHFAFASPLLAIPSSLPLRALTSAISLITKSPFTIIKSDKMMISAMVFIVNRSFC